MGYSIYITRDSPILLDEWKAVVAGRTDVRLQLQPTSFQNPRTGEVVRFRLGEGDAEVYVDNQWHPCFRWREGELVFGAPRGFDDPATPFRAIVRAVAYALGARVVGEGEEPYE